MTNQRVLFEQINDALPQTQCTQCGFNGCAPYAHAIAFDEVPINQCPPGGHHGIVELARITNRSVIPLNPENGIEQALHVAHIIESECIGCTKCIQACPVDAIVGSSKLMHTVLTDWCTGCGLCVPPCPVDCIEMPVAQKSNWQTTDAQTARTRYEFRNARLIREQNELQHKRTARSKHALNSADDTHNKQNMVEAALARARARRQGKQHGQ